MWLAKRQNKSNILFREIGTSVCVSICLSICMFVCMCVWGGGGGQRKFSNKHKYKKKHTQKIIWKNKVVYIFPRVKKNRRQRRKKKSVCLQSTLPICTNYSYRYCYSYLLLNSFLKQRLRLKVHQNTEIKSNATLRIYIISSPLRNTIFYLCIHIYHY